MTMKSKETIVMRPISREVQRGFLADLGGLVSVILRSPPATGCINSPEESGRRRAEVSGGQTGTSSNHKRSNTSRKCVVFRFFDISYF